MLSVFMRLAERTSTVLWKMLPVFIRLVARSFTVLPPPTLVPGQMLSVFYYVYCASFYCATPPIHYCWGTLLLGQKLPVFMRLAVRLSTVLPPRKLLLGPMLPVFARLTGRSSTVLPPLHYRTQVTNCMFLCDGRRSFRRPFTLMRATIEAALLSDLVSERRGYLT